MGLRAREARQAEEMRRLRAQLDWAGAFLLEKNGDLIPRLVSCLRDVRSVVATVADTGPVVDRIDALLREAAGDV